MADTKTAFKNMSASQIAAKINKSGLSNDSKDYVLEIASGPSAKADIIQYAEESDLFPIFGLEYSKGGSVNKTRTGPSDYRKGGMVLSTVDRRKK